MNGYCFGCEKETEMIRVQPLTERLPTFKYCPQCLRAYDVGTGESINIHDSRRAYFDRDFIDYDESARRIVTGKLVTKQELNLSLRERE